MWARNAAGEREIAPLFSAANSKQEFSAFLITEGCVRGDVGSGKRKAYQEFVSLHMNTWMVLGPTDMSRWKSNKCSQGPYRAVHFTQGPANSILYTGEILTGHTGASKVYIILKFGGGGTGVSNIVRLLA